MVQPVERGVFLCERIVLLCERTVACRESFGFLFERLDAALEIGERLVRCRLLGACRGKLGRRILELFLRFPHRAVELLHAEERRAHVFRSGSKDDERQRRDDEARDDGDDGRRMTRPEAEE